MATIRERRTGVWEVRGYTGRDREGNPTQLSRTVHGTKRDAQRVAAELTVKPSRNAAGRKVGQLLDEWLEIKTPSWADLTVRDQTSRARLVADDPIGNMSVASIGVSDVDRWVGRLRKAGVGEGSIRNQHTVLRSALQQAVRWEWIATNPASAAPIEHPKRQQQRTLTNDEVRALIEAASQVHEMAPLAFRLAAETGARRGELAALRWDKFVDDRVVVDGQVIVSTVDGIRGPRLTPTKTGSRRVVTLSPSLVEMVEAARAKFGDITTWLFTPDAEPPNPDRIGWWWRRSRELADVDCRWRLHDLRHWSATQSIASGQDVRTVAHRLGHADPAMTLRVYAHAVERADEALAKILGEALD
ncbi:MAG: site-specific integrase [Sulfitobacter sp.]|nr:site-specific integrase [Sulfitobacter sp.]